MARVQGASLKLLFCAIAGSLGNSSSLILGVIPGSDSAPCVVFRRSPYTCHDPRACFSPPQFTKFLKRDYARWAEGDDSRGAVVSEGEALIEQDHE